MKKLLLPMIALLFFACEAPKSSEITTDTTAFAPEQTINPTSTEKAIDTAVTTNTPTSNPSSIVDYYNILKANNLVDAYSIENNNNNNKWVCFDSEDKEVTHPLVADLKNGYLEIQDEGTGGGTSYIELALFKKADGSFILALNTYYKEATGLYVTVMNSKLKFYRYENNTLKDITNLSLKNKISSIDFLKLTYAGDGTLEFHYLLPRVGTTIEAVYNKDYREFCANKSRYKENMEEAAYDKIVDDCLICDQIIKERISLYFDKPKGFFFMKE